MLNKSIKFRWNFDNKVHNAKILNIIKNDILRVRIEDVFGCPIILIKKENVLK